ncbi:MAG: SPOR domain-containing protein [Desulfomonile tiedjei]|uniref:SPOR domain-containing protein n=1 Tax=Desulfomonile tiedjei TaxID=2358 RepID=A0A9D6V3I5_9BACT|nr:SPOR domain-containing protein [Desulfomonile tiedjei]
MKPLSIMRKMVSGKKRPIKVSPAAQNAAVKLAGPKSPKKKPFSRLTEFFRQKRKSRSAPPPPLKPEGEGTKPKNGWLALGVMGAALIAGVLAVADFKLIRDPTVFGKAFGTGRQRAESLEPAAAATGSSGALDSKAAHERPEVTFYQKLTSQDEQKTMGTGNNCQIQETDITDKRAAKSHSAANPEKSEDPRTRMQPEKTSTAGQPPLQPAIGPIKYTVQVGAFSHPSIAQEWAIKWKSRGYDAYLKPVARPNTGIIYRLYLGNFASEKQADELVKHLKAKEGISALRLAVRN